MTWGLGPLAMNLLTPVEAAKILNVSVRAFNQMVRKGFITPVFPEGRKWNGKRLYHEQDIADLIEVHAQKWDLATTTALAKQALVRTRQLERSVNSLMNVIGANMKPLSLKPRDITKLYLEIEHELHQLDPYTAEEILRWAHVFYAMGEEYLWCIEQEIEDPEPWKKPLLLAEKLMEELPRDHCKINRELEIAYQILDMARRNMRNVSYFYIRHRKSQRAAHKAFPALEGDIHEEILSFAYIK